MVCGDKSRNKENHGNTMSRFGSAMSWLWCVLLGAVLWSGVVSQAYSQSSIRARLAGWPNSFNPLISSDVHADLVASFVHATLLVKRQDNGKLYPYLAKSFDISKDGTTYAFALHPDATFSSGAAVKAQDVVFTYNLVLSGKYCTTCAHLKHVRAVVEKVRAKGSSSVVVQMRYSGVFHGDIFTKIPILEQSIYENIDFSKGSLAVPVGAGAYKYDSQSSEDRKKIVLLNRSQSWLKQDPYFSKIGNFESMELVLLKNSKLAYSALLDGRIDVLYFSDDIIGLWGRQQKNSKGEPSNIAWDMSNKRDPFSLKQMIFHTKKGVLRDKGFRKALYHLFDGKGIVEKYYKTHFELAAAPLFLPSNNSLVKMDFDVKQAVSALAKIGYDKKDNNGVLYRSKSSSHKFSKAQVRIAYSNPNYSSWLEEYAMLAKKVGVEISLTFMNFADLFSSLDAGEFDVVVVNEYKPAHVHPLAAAYGSFAHEYSRYPSSSTQKMQKAIKDGNRLSLELMEHLQNVAKDIIDAYAVVYLWQRRYHHIGYIKDRVKPVGKAFWPYSGNDSSDVYYTHWQSVEK